ncbi:sulfatase-like hydrolase/transferase [Shewanella sp.]|uniref:sulfatase-like hydrolase/transferase n=1 Tax=Shewanella sp. TaxID=50422 RepID=UPI001ED4C7C7|nr:sulfatase-like hydrolase/transferase [Shewanella sp.]NRB23429.1 sulfatase-like hydrolase/transferase [Shewanella sp.]
MAKKLEQMTNNLSMMRTFWRTNAMMLLSLVALFNFKQLLQYYSSISIAQAMTHLGNDNLFSLWLTLDLLKFVFLVIVLHVLWAFIITLSCKPWFMIFRNAGIRTQIWLVIMLSHITLVLGANAYWYPTSLLGFLRDTPLTMPWVLTLLLTALCCLFLWGLVTLVGNRLTFSLLAICLIMASISTRSSSEHYAPTDNTSPNVFIIGIDALRPDHLSFRDPDNNFTPSINQFIQQSLLYDKTYTPLGRTYVAWMSILTGQYPVTHGARFNLTPPELIDKPLPLIRELKARGYQTTYGIDERRFNQIDTEYGFEQVIGPKIGAADAIITSVGDIPLINILLKLAVSESLFPYLYMNRAYGKAYDPTLFNRKLTDALSTSRPNFLAVHFCLLHWPFTSKNFIDVNTATWKGNYNHFMYQTMLSQVDSQFQQFMDTLQDRGFLDNALIYLISDHGEGFMLEKDTLQGNQPEDEAKLNVNAWGHGTNVLSQEQANVLMAYRRFNPQVETAKHIQGIYSLTDITPSLFKELGLSLAPTDKAFDGHVLPKTLSQEVSKSVFVESSIPIKSINASFIDEAKVLSESLSKYEIRENGRAVLVPSTYKEMIAKKQRSVYFQHWQLAMLPDYEDLILVDTHQNRWYSLEKYQGDAPWRKMLSDLCTHYRDDKGFDPNSKCQQAQLSSKRLAANTD